MVDQVHIWLSLHILGLIIGDDLGNGSEQFGQESRQTDRPIPAQVAALINPDGKLEMDENIANPVLALVVPANEGALGIPQHSMEPAIVIHNGLRGVDDVLGLRHQGIENVFFLHLITNSDRV